MSLPICPNASGHKQRLVEGFAKRYGLDQLVWYEYHDDMEQAILREKQLKK